MQVLDQQLIHCAASSCRLDPGQKTQREATRDDRNQLKWQRPPAFVSEQLRPTQTVPTVLTGVQHAGSGGFTSAVVCGGACGSGESGSEGSEAVRSWVPEGRGLHLWRLPLEETPHWDRHGWWRWEKLYLYLKTAELIPCVCWFGSGYS